MEGSTMRWHTSIGMAVKESRCHRDLNARTPKSKKLESYVVKSNLLKKKH
jgi:hypothetical protein